MGNNIDYTQIEILGLLSGSYVIYGSGPLGIRGIREVGDIDILVTPELFERLIIEFPDTEVGQTAGGDRKLEFGMIEICDTCPGLTIDQCREAISSADFFDGYPFLNLSWLIHVKKTMNRDKDRRDLQLLQAYLDAGGK